MKHALLDWERNGYHDSDFYCIYFDDVAGELGQIMTGSTAYAGGPGYGDVVVHDTGVPADILERARLALANSIFASIRAAEHRDVLEPNSAPFGTSVRLLRDSSARSKSKYTAGMTGEVYWSGNYGTFYRKGYNRPGRDNARVGIRLADGSRIFAPLKDCRLDREPMSDEELRQRADSLSHDYNFGALFRGFAWGSKAHFRAPQALAA